jgi:hypothetical protein
MRKLLLLSTILALAVPLAAQRGGGGGGGNLGALGQAVRRPPAPTGPAPRLPNGHIDLSGVWVGGGAVNDMERDGGLKPGTMDELMLPWAKKLRDSRNEVDEPYLQCLPAGIVRGTPYPWRIVQNRTHAPETHIFRIEEGSIHSYRQIFMDGRAHPPEPDPTWYGHSVGRWEGDTLVVDTVGYNGKFWFDRRGHPHTEQLHVVERYTRVDMGRLQIQVTIDDPGAYVKPFTLTFNARLAPGDEIMENICQENNQFGIAGGHDVPSAKQAPATPAR